MRLLRVLGAFALILVLGACASGVNLHVPSDLTGNPVHKNGVRWPEEMVKKHGVTNVTQFTIPMPGALLAELGESQEDGNPVFMGTWQAMGLDGNKPVTAICYFSGFAGPTPTLTCLQYGRHYVPSDAARFVLFSADSQYAFTLNGSAIPSLGCVHGRPANDELTYNPNRFDGEKGYKEKFIAKYGTSFPELQAYWNNAEKALGGLELGVTPVSRFTVGSSEWQTWLATVGKQLPNRCEMEGWVYATAFSCKTFARKATDNPGFTAGERAAQQFGLPISDGPGLIVTAPLSLVSAMIGGGMSEPRGDYLCATNPNTNMAAKFERLVQFYQGETAALSRANGAMAKALANEQTTPVRRK